MKPNLTWFTCTPKRFVGDHTFFARDSGLLCKGFQEIGVTCKAIMPGPAMGVDQTEDLIRTEYKNLEDAEWWRSLGGDGVVFYGWGDGRYLKIAQAIKNADLILVSHMDTAGMLGILNGFVTFSKSLLSVCTGEASYRVAGYARFAIRLAYASSIGLLKNDLGRAKHLKEADVIGAITPIAMARIRKVCRIYGGDALAEKVQLIPHPNSSKMRYDPSVKKEQLMIAIGRWNDEKIKGTHLLLETIPIVLRSSTTAEFEIYGKPPISMEKWHELLPDGIKKRVKIMGVVRNEILSLALQRAQISLCTSLREGYHTASAEALCCGCSVVGPDVEEIPSMKWFTKGGVGEMAKRTPEAISDAILKELLSWQREERDPAAISQQWSTLLHAPEIARLILRACGIQIAP